MNEFYKDLWIKAQKLAEENYEKEYGACTWDDADKYEREDWVFAEYDRLRKERENMVQRDSKGRFVSTKANGNNETTNTTNNKKENDTMNKTNAKEMRMETLKANGVNTNNFFDLTMRVPFGAEVKIMVDGQEMIVPATNGVVCGATCGETDNVSTATAYGNHVVGSGLIGYCVGTPTFVASNGDICDAESGEVLVMANDSIAQSIINDGYVKNSKLFRRWIFAKTMNMLDYVDRRNSNRKGWEACMKDCYAYSYQFEMMADELHTLAKLQKEDPEYFAERTKFFNGNVAVVLLEDYFYRLKKYVKKQMRENPRKYRGEQYVKLARYGNVLVKDLNNKVYIPIEMGIDDVRDAVRNNNYVLIEKEFRNFMNKLYNKLPYDTPKCAVFKDAYKGAGSYYSLQNAIRWHNVILKNCNHKYDSELRLKELLNGEYRNDVWRFHNLLVETIEYNKFDLRRSIAEGNMADGTKSHKAEAIARRYYK